MCNCIVLTCTSYNLVYDIRLVDCLPLRIVIEHDYTFPLEVNNASHHNK